MTAAFLATLPAIALGWMAVRLLLPAIAWKPAWMRWLFELSLGTAVGLGLTSCFCFVLRLAGAGGRGPVLALDAATLAGAAWLYVRSRRKEGDAPTPPGFSFSWVLRTAMAVALMLFALDMNESIAANPQGEWDAWAIWNVKAKFLAGGADTWRNAVAADAAAKMFGASHPGYPLLVSASVARVWTLTGDPSSEAPAALGVVFALAAAGLLAGALALVRTETAGLLAMLVLVATGAFTSQVGFQYADIPLSLYILATVALLAYAPAANWPPGLLVLAGLCAGFADWTKNEGLPFLLLAALVVLWRARGRRAAWMALGAAPAVLLVAALKLFLAHGTEAMFPRTAAETAAKLADPARWLQIAAAFAKMILDLGVPWAHPVLLLAVLAVALGVVSKKEAASRLWLALPLAGLLAADFAIYLITTADLTWHLGTSVNRLIVQVWPATLFVAFLLIQPPASPLPEPVAAPAARRSDRREQRRLKRSAEPR